MTALDGDWSDLPMLDEGFYVYALYGAADELLYIGKSATPAARIESHRRDPAKRGRFTRAAIHRCASPADMDETEARLIVAHMPPWNISGLPLEVKAERLLAKHGPSYQLRPRGPMPVEAVVSLKRTAYSLREVTAATGLSLRQVQRLAGTGELPSGLIGRKRVVLAEDFDTFIASIKQSS